MDELDGLEEIFFGNKEVKDRKELAKLKGLYIYSWLLDPPKQPCVHVPYNLLVYLARVAPEKNKENFMLDKLRAYGYIRNLVPKNLEEKIKYAIKWSRDFHRVEEVEISLNQTERDAIEDLVQAMEIEDDDDDEKIQNTIFNIARKHSLSPKKFFKTLYLILLGFPQGPKLGSYIRAMGKESVMNSLKNVLAKSKQN